MKTYRMHRNEALPFLQSLSWNEAKDAKIEYIPLDLTQYKDITPETGNWINILFREETEDKHGNYMLRGFSYHGADEVRLLKMRFGDTSPSDLNFWAFNDEEKLLYTFCEGDTTVTLFKDVASYEAQKHDTRKWYIENY